MRHFDEQLQAVGAGELRGHVLRTASLERFAHGLDGVPRLENEGRAHARAILVPGADQLGLQQLELTPAGRGRGARIHGDGVATTGLLHRLRQTEQERRAISRRPPPRALGAPGYGGVRCGR